MVGRDVIIFGIFCKFPSEFISPIRKYVVISPFPLKNHFNKLEKCASLRRKRRGVGRNCHAFKRIYRL